MEQPTAQGLSPAGNKTCCAIINSPCEKAGFETQKLKFFKLCESFNVKQGELSSCGNWTISKVECLGACHEAPVIQINTEDYIGKVKKDEALSLLKSKQNAL